MRGTTSPRFSTRAAGAPRRQPRRAGRSRSAAATPPSIGRRLLRSTRPRAALQPAAPRRVDVCARPEYTGGPMSDNGDSASRDPRGNRLALLALGALGIVYGDIGTSPLYAFRECFNEHTGLPLNVPNVLGVLSLVFWSITVVVTINCPVSVRRAENNGEGGILALRTLVRWRPPPGDPLRVTLIVLGLFGASLLYGDSIITPAISILSAVEGLEVATPAFRPYVLMIAVT